MGDLDPLDPERYFRANGRTAEGDPIADRHGAAVRHGVDAAVLREVQRVAARNDARRARRYMTEREMRVDAGVQLTPHEEAEPAVDAEVVQRAESERSTAPLVRNAPAGALGLVGGEGEIFGRVLAVAHAEAEEDRRCSFERPLRAE